MDNTTLRYRPPGPELDRVPFAYRSLGKDDAGMSIVEGPRAFKVEASEARIFQFRGSLWTVLASADETDGVVGAMDERCAQGIRAPMHVHDDADEIFYVLEGNLTFFVGEQRIETAPGAFVYLPRFVHHGFQCNSAEARVFNFLTPAGFEQLILDNGTLVRYDDGPVPEDQQAAPAQVPPEVYRSKYHMRTLPPGST
jgi:quercetin dioxygenase-like cupin family protein